MAMECQRLSDISGFNRQWAEEQWQEAARHRKLVLHGDERLAKETFVVTRARHLRRETLKRLAQMTLAGALPQTLNELRHGQCSRSGNHCLEVDDNAPTCTEDLHRVALDRLIQVALTGGLPEQINRVLSVAKEDVASSRDAFASRKRDLRRGALERLTKATLRGELPLKLKELRERVSSPHGQEIHDRSTATQGKRDVPVDVCTDLSKEVARSGELQFPRNHTRQLRHNTLRRLAQATHSGALQQNMKSLQHFEMTGTSSTKDAVVPCSRNPAMELRGEVLRRLAQATLSGALQKKIVDARQNECAQTHRATDLRKEVLRRMAQDTISGALPQRLGLLRHLQRKPHEIESLVERTSSNQARNSRHEVLQRLAQATLNASLKEKLFILQRRGCTSVEEEEEVAPSTYLHGDVVQHLVQLTLSGMTTETLKEARHPQAESEGTIALAPTLVHCSRDSRQEVLMRLAQATLAGTIPKKLQQARRQRASREAEIVVASSSDLRQQALRRLAQATLSGTLPSKLKAARGADISYTDIGATSYSMTNRLEVLQRLAQTSLSGALPQRLKEARGSQYENRDKPENMEIEVSMSSRNPNTELRREVLRRLAQDTLSGALPQSLERARDLRCTTDDTKCAVVPTSANEVGNAPVSFVTDDIDLRREALRRLTSSTLSGTLAPRLQNLRCGHEETSRNTVGGLRQDALKCLAQIAISGALPQKLTDFRNSLHGRNDTNTLGHGNCTNQTNLRRDVLKRIAEVTLSGTLPERLKAKRSQQSGSDVMDALRRIDLRPDSLKHLSQVTLASEVPTTQHQVRHHCRPGMPKVKQDADTVKKEPPQDAMKRFAQFILAGGLPGALDKIRAERECSPNALRQAVSMRLAEIALAGALPQKLEECRKKQRAELRQVALTRLAQVTLDGGLSSILKKFKDEQRAKRSGAIPHKLQTDDEARLSSLITSQPPDASMPSSSLRSLAASSSSASSLSTSNSAPKIETCKDEMRDAYKELAIAGNMHLASKRAAKLATDLIFAIVLDKAGQQTNQEEFEAALSTLAKKTGMSEEMQDLAQSSASKLLQSSSASNPMLEDQPSVISKAVCQTVIQAAKSASLRPASLKPSGIPNLRLRYPSKRSTDQAQPEDQDVGKPEASESSSTLRRPALLKPSSLANVTLLHRSIRERSSAENEHVNNASAAAPISLPASALRAPSMRPSSVPSSGVFLRKRSTRYASPAHVSTSSPKEPSAQLERMRRSPYHAQSRPSRELNPLEDPKLNRHSSEPWFIRPSFDPSFILQARGLTPLLRESLECDTRKTHQTAEVRARAPSFSKSSSAYSGSRRRPRIISGESAASYETPSRQISGESAPSSLPAPPDLRASSRTPPPPPTSPTPSAASPASPKRSFSVQRRARPRPLGPLCDAGEFPGVRKPREKYPFPELPICSLSSPKSKTTTTDPANSSESELLAQSVGRKVSTPEVSEPVVADLLQTMRTAIAQPRRIVEGEEKVQSDFLPERRECASPELPRLATQLAQSEPAQAHSLDDSVVRRKIGHALAAALSFALQAAHVNQAVENVVDSVAQAEESQDAAVLHRQRLPAPEVPAPSFTELMQTLGSAVAQSRIVVSELKANESNRLASQCSPKSEKGAGSSAGLDVDPIPQPTYSSPSVPGKTFTDFLQTMGQTIASQIDDKSENATTPEEKHEVQKAPRHSPFMRPSCATSSMLLYRPSPPTTPSVGRPQSKQVGRRSSLPTVVSESSQRAMSPASVARLQTNQSLPSTPAGTNPTALAYSNVDSYTYVPSRGPSTVRDVYVSFCSSSRDGLSCKGFAKLCKHVGLSNDEFRVSDLSAICNEVLPKGKRHMNFAQFEHALMLLASNDDVREAALRRQIESSGASGQENIGAQASARSGVSNSQPPSTARSAVSASQDEIRSQTPLSLRPLMNFSRSPSNTPPITPVLKGFSKASPTSDGLSTCSTSFGTCSTSCSTAVSSAAPTPTARSTAQKSDVQFGLPPPSPESSASSSSTSQPVSPAQTPQLSLRRLLKDGAVATGAGRRGLKAVAQDALDAALLFRVEATNQDILVEQLHHARVKASVALTFALLMEAREYNIDVGPKEILEAREKVQRTLDFIFHSNKNMKVDAHDLFKLRTHAQDAIRVALFDTQTSGNEEVNRSMQASAPEALKEVFLLTSKALRGHLSGDRLDDAKKRAHDAVARAVIAEMRCCGIEVDNSSQKFMQDLKRTQRRVHAALDSTFLADADVCAAADYPKMQIRAMNSLHLAMIGVKVQP